MLVADASALYALVDAADDHHPKAKSEAGRERPFVVPSEVLVETLGLVRKRLGRDASLAFLRALRDMPHARIAGSRQAIIDQSVASSVTPGSLSYQDWIVVHTCRALGGQPWTFDDDLRRAVKA